MSHLNSVFASRETQFDDTSVSGGGLRVGMAAYSLQEKSALSTLPYKPLPVQTCDIKIQLRRVIISRRVPSIGIAKLGEMHGGFTFDTVNDMGVTLCGGYKLHSGLLLNFVKGSLKCFLVDLVHYKWFHSFDLDADNGQVRESTRVGAWQNQSSEEVSSLTIVQTLLQTREDISANTLHCKRAETKFYTMLSPNLVQEQNHKFSYGYASSPGKRSSMEDFYETQICGIDGQIVGLFGVFDGHGGARAAEYVKQNLFLNLINHPKFISDTKVAIADAYKQTDSDFLKAENNQHRDAGSTASTAVLVGDRLLVANVGDSRAVICRAGKAIALSRDHKPNQTDERQRIEDAGGFVMWAGTWRVGGVLAVSRAFGDRLLKQYVVAEPEIQVSM
eukprot:Gb_37114 [translate_table: standard]